MGDEKYIVIREVVRKKNPRLLKILPGFVISYIERIVHEDEINAIMSKIGRYEGLEFIDKALEELKIEVELTGAENIQLEGGVFFASNHPLGGLDGMAFMHALGKYRTDIKFMVNDLLMNIKNLQPLFIPINKHGGQARDAINLINETYASDQALLVFPAGLVSRKGKNGVIKDLEWKKTFINKAKRFKKDIIPVYIEGQNSKFFYNLARFRKKIGLEANLEMFYLVDEMFAQRGKKVTIHMGKPLPYTHFDKSKSDSEWAEEVKNIVYSMSKS